VAKYFAKKTACIYGHLHDSKRESVRCGELHIMQRSGFISGLIIQPEYKFAVNGDWLKLRNGQVAGYKADFSYKEGNRIVVEDVKGFMVRDFALRAALFRHLNPEIELRVTK
jgi:hypothetical protein